ncbi:MAG: arylsulfatase [Planctomycetales bacterium]|nr:arylsulfatase [Planctomycetales bacterium]
MAVLVAQTIGAKRVDADQVSRPNIVVIMADDLGYAELGSYGQTKIKTPHLDRMAAEGMRFTQHYTSAPVCAPARCSLMTGRHGGHAYVRDNFEVGDWDSYRGQMPLPSTERTMAEMLTDHGYCCGAFGKWGLGEVGSDGDPLRHGFARFFGYNCQRHAHNLFPRYLVDDAGKRMLPGNTRGLTGETYGPAVIADEALKFIRENHQRPFFVYYPTVIPHLALQVPESELDQYRGQWQETPYTGKSYLPHPTPRAAYAAMITFMDKQVGRLLSLLKELKIDDNTIVFFTSDNGTTFLKPQVDYEFFASVGSLRGLKGSVYEGGIRVPMLVRWPGKIKSGAVSDHVCAHYDLLATLAELTGSTAPDNDGLSYLPELLGKSQSKHEALVWDFAGYGGQLAIRQGDWKAVRRDIKKNAEAPWELYDLKHDPGEQNNVAAMQPDVSSRLQQLMRNSRTAPQVERFRFGEYPQ